MSEDYETVHNMSEDYETVHKMNGVCISSCRDMPHATFGDSTFQQRYGTSLVS